MTGEELNRNPLALRALGEERLPKTGDELLFFIGDARREFVVTKVLPRSEANLAAIRSKASPLAKPTPAPTDHGVPAFNGAAGGTGGGFGGGVMAEFKPEIPPYRGTKIVPHPDAKGELLKLQQEFAMAMTLADPVPVVRTAHFAWLDQNEEMRRFRITRMGWYGGITSVEPRPAGGWVVRLVIRPWLYIPFRGYLPDYVEETYDFVGGYPRLTGSDAAVAKVNLQRFSRF